MRSLDADNFYWSAIPPRKPYPLLREIARVLREGLTLDPQAVGHCGTLPACTDWWMLEADPLCGGVQYFYS